MKDFITVLRDRNMALLLSGRLISTGGDWLYDIAMSIALYRYSSGNSFLVSLLWFSHLLPSMFLGPFAGSLVDRIGYRRAMIMADLGRMIAVGILAVILSPSTYAIAYPLAFCISSLGNLFRPASAGIVPAIVTSQEERLQANAALGEISSIAMIAGTAVGGVVAGFGLINQLLVIQAASFGVSALSLWLIRLHAIAPAGEETAPKEMEEAVGGMVAGLRLVMRRPLLVMAGIVMAIPQLLSGSVLIWLVGYSIHTLHLGNGGVGYLYCAIGVGAAVGGLAAAAIGGKYPLHYLLMAGMAVLGLATVMLGAVPVSLVALASVFVVGLSETVGLTAYDTLLQQAAPRNMIGRVSGTMDSLFYNLIVLGTLASGLLAVWPGIQVSMIVLGALAVAAVGLGWLNLNRMTAEQPDAAELAGVPAFARVPVSVREWAVRRMVRERFPPGALVIRQGDEGDTFYTIADGTAEVEVAANGRTVTRQLGPGDFFGEIALLQKVPRTATVRALDGLTVYSLSREDFEELQDRAVQFKESLLQVARQRLAQDRNLRISLPARG